MRYNIKIISRTANALTIAVALIGVSLILYSQSLLRHYDQQVTQADNARLLSQAVYAEGLQLGQATRNIVLNPSDTKAAANYDKAEQDLNDALKRLQAQSLVSEDETMRQLLVDLDKGLQSDILAQRAIHGLAHKGQSKNAAEALTKQETPLWRKCKAMIFKAEDWCRSEGNQINAKATTQDRITDYSLWIMGLLLVLTPAATSLVSGRAFKQVRRTIHSAAAVTRNLKGTASEVSRMSQNLAEGSSEQAASIEETSSSLEEMSSMTKRNAENAQRANELAKQARSAAENGVQDMQMMNTAVEAIKDSSDDIAKIIKTIDEIAFQTNILALNAAVEAARAGEAGMGFAVVADEVRNLAQRSAQAAKETAAKIEGAIGKTTQGVEISIKVAQALNEIVAKARQVDELVAEVANASREQTQGITQINTAVTQMDKVTQSNAASAEESAAAAEELNAQAETMKRSVAELLKLVGENAAAGSNRSMHPVESPDYVTTARSLQNGHTSTTWRKEQIRSVGQTSPAARNGFASAPRRNGAGVIAWDEPSMATGVDSIDSQHQTLIQHIDELHSACLAGTAKEELLKMLDFLGSYVQSHFKHEEGVMQEHKCPVRGKNKAAHTQFLKDYESLVEIVKREGASTTVVIQLKEMLGNWLKNHICRIDTNLRNCTVHQF